MRRLLAVKAGAGSGKTYSLALRYISLLLHGASPSEILAITFTNKASNEIGERIIHFLKWPEWEEGEEKEKLLQNLSREAEISPARVAQILEEGEVLERVLTSPLHIGTIDSFLHKIIRKFGLFVGIEPSFRVKEGGKEGEIEELFWSSLENLEEVRHFLENFDSSQLFTSLHQLYVRWNESYPLLKRWASTPYPFPPDQLHQLKAEQEELKEWIFQGLTNKKWNTTIITKFKNGDEELITYLNRVGKKGYAPLEEWKQKIQRYIDISLLLEKFEELKELELWFKLLSVYREVRRRWGREREEYTFDDIAIGVWELLQHHLDRDFFYFRLDSRFTHILIDEFQDTSILQWKILEPLIEEIKSGEGVKGERTFFYVGDTNQAIYRWRGGEDRLFCYLYHSLRPYGMELVQLPNNFRTGRRIGEEVNRLFGVTQQFVKEGGYLEIATGQLNQRGSWLLSQLERLKEKGVRWEDIAILVRKNDEVEEFAQLLEEAGIPVTTSTSKILIHLPIVNGVVGAMKYLYLRERGEEGKGRFYLLQFETVLGREVSPDQLPNPVGKSPAQLVREFMERFDLRYPELMELWELCLSFPTLAHFYHQIDSQNREIEGRELKGVNIMTIHKSKGLEFEFVIVMDGRSRPPGSKKNRYIFDTSGKCDCEERGPGCRQLEATQIRKHFPQKSLHYLWDEEFHRLYEEERAAQIQESLNLEYVAFTRAKRGLFIFKAVTRGWFKTDLEPGSWGELEGESQSDQSPSREVVKMVRWGEQERGESEEEEPETEQNWEAVYWGTALHYGLEVESVDGVRNRFGLYLREGWEAVLERGLARLKSQFPGEWRREVPFRFNGREYRCDLLVFEKGELRWIVDYKSTLNPLFASQYRQQVEEYGKVLKELLQLEGEPKTLLFSLREEEEEI